MHLAVAIVASTALTYACGGDSSVTRPPDGGGGGGDPVIVCGADTASLNHVAAGTYQLSSFDGSPPPRAVRQSGGAPGEVDWGIVTLGAGGSYDIKLGQFWYGQARVSDADHGTYTQCGSTLSLHSTQRAGILYPGSASTGLVNVDFPASYAGSAGFRVALAFETQPCGPDGPDLMPLVTRSYALTNIGGRALPDTLPEDYPNRVVVASASASLRADSTFALTVNGVVSDSGSFVKCSARIRFHSHGGFYYGSIADDSLLIRYPAAFILNYDLYAFGNSSDAFNLSFEASH